MAKTERYTFRLDPEVKRDAEELFGRCGISMATALNLFLRRCIQENGLPFPVEADNKTERETNNK